MSGSSSSTSLLTCVNGLALTRLSVSVTMVEKVSQVNFADPKFKRLTERLVVRAHPGAPNDNGLLLIPVGEVAVVVFRLLGFKTWAC